MITICARCGKEAENQQRLEYAPGIFICGEEDRRSCGTCPAYGGASLHKDRGEHKHFCDSMWSEHVGVHECRCGFRWKVYAEPLDFSI